MINLITLAQIYEENKKHDTEIKLNINKREAYVEAWKYQIS